MSEDKPSIETLKLSIPNELGGLHKRIDDVSQFLDDKIIIFDTELNDRVTDLRERVNFVQDSSSKSIRNVFFISVFFNLFILTMFYIFLVKT